MKKNNKIDLSNNKGITIVALVIIVIIMIILMGVSITVGTGTLDSTKLQGFYMQLEIIQKRIDDIASTNESYVDSSGNTIYLKEQGIAFENLDEAKQNKLLDIISKEASEEELDETSFRYFTKEQANTILDLTDIEYNIFVDFNTRTIIAEEGIKINGQEYHILINKIYFAQQNTGKNEGTLTALSYNISTYGSNSYKIIVIPSNTIGDLAGNGTLRYKKSTSKYWETADNLEIIITDLTQYDIEYKDRNNNTISEVIIVSVNEIGQPTVSPVSQ